MVVIALWILFALISRLYLVNPRANEVMKATVREKNIVIDFLIYGPLAFLQTGIYSLSMPEALFTTSVTGRIFNAVATIGGFLIVLFYNQDLLSSLAIPSYEKPIETVTGCIEK